jgi:hypothetical protein
MLELRPNCECCDRDLKPDARDAMICTFECTFCSACARDVLHGHVPELRRRARAAPGAARPAKLARHPGVDQAHRQGTRLRGLTR